MEDKDYTGIYFFIPSIGIWVYQLFFWLKYGSWNGISLLDTLAYISDRYWFEYPDGWLGLHALLGFIPISIFFLVIGIVLFVLSE